MRLLAGTPAKASTAPVPRQYDSIILPRGQKLASKIIGHIIEIIYASIPAYGHDETLQMESVCNC